MIVIPAIDIIGGSCVRLSMGDYDRKTEYPEDPVSVAKKIEASGLTHLHLVDLDGAKQGRVVNLNVLKSICNETDLIVDFGGGVRTKEDLENVLEAGANMVTGGSIAVRDRREFESWIEEFPGKLILGADVKAGRVAVSGWTESSGHGLAEFVDSYLAKGVRRIVCTEIERDGMMSGPAKKMYVEMIDRFPEAEWVASGGIRGQEDLLEMEDIGMWGAIVGKAFHDGVMSLKEMTEINGRHALLPNKYPKDN